MGGLYLAEVAVELARETERAGGAADSGGDEVVEVLVGGVGELQGAEADVVQRLLFEKIGRWVGGWLSYVCTGRKVEEVGGWVVELRMY